MVAFSDSTDGRFPRALQVTGATRGGEPGAPSAAPGAEPSVAAAAAIAEHRSADFGVVNRLYPSLLDAIIIVKPETLLRWHRRGFRAYWRWKSWRRGGRPRIDRELGALIRRMSKENPTWGAPRIHGELLMLGIDVSRVDGRTIHDQDWPTAVAGLENVAA
jgi:hypothetical protein